MHNVAMATLAETYSSLLGDYLSVVKVIFVLVLATAWLAACPWVHKDTRKVRAPQELWSGAVLVAGMLGLLIWLLMPIYIVGMLVFIVLAGAALLAYVVYRNGRVEPDARVLTAHHFQSLLSPQKEVKVDVVSKVRLYGADTRIVQPPVDQKADAAEKQTYNLAQGLLYDILYYRASEADLMPAGSEARVRLVIDGVVNERPPMSAADCERVIQYLKPIGGMNADERRRPQQGKISVDLAGSPIDMMLTTAGTTTGQRMQFKIVQEFVQTQIDLLGMSPEVLAAVKGMSKASGLLIVAGRPGNGVTSTLYSLLRAQDAFVKQLVTLEAKPVVDLENVTQTAYGDQSKLAGALATVSRRDPDMLMIDRCDDPKAAPTIIEMAARKTVMLGMIASDSFTAMAKWVRLCGRSELAAPPLRGVLCQMLVRKLCPACKEAYRPDPKFLAKANLPAQRIENFYRPPSRPLVDEKGQVYICPTCQGVGYHGRTAVFELLELTDEIRQLVASGAPLPQLQAACRKNKMLYLQEQALRKVVEGLTSVQEVLRVTRQDKKS
ncbi:MAG: GspE/PulE family protein [Phycisphaerae bacterium]